MRAWFQRGFALLLILAVGVAGNLHLPIVQAVAWARMYSQFRAAYPSSVALSITFSGEYPCNLCKLVSSAEREHDQPAGSMISSLRLLLPLPQMAALVAPSPEIQNQGWSEPTARVPMGLTRPEVPPPRQA